MLKRILLTAGMGYLARRFFGGRGMATSRVSPGYSRWGGRRGW